MKSSKSSKSSKTMKKNNSRISRKSKLSKLSKKLRLKIHRGGSISRAKRFGAIRRTRGADVSNTLNHIWFRDWPDHGVPTKLENFITFIKAVYKDIQENGGTTVIHCSAGIGRTGVVYLVLKLMFDKNYVIGGNLQELGITAKNITDALTTAREYRMKLVQTPEQLKFIMNVFGINISIKDITVMYKIILPYGNLNADNAATTIASKCSIKNRYADILPYDNNRVILGNTTEICDSYINASPMEDGAFGGLNVITAQCPIANTIKDFIRMLNNSTDNDNIKRIVMVTNLVEEGKLKCNDYTGDLYKIAKPTDGSSFSIVKYKKILPDKLEMVDHIERHNEETSSNRNSPLHFENIRQNLRQFQKKNNVVADEDGIFGTVPPDLQAEWDRKLSSQLSSQRSSQRSLH